MITQFKIFEDIDNNILKYSIPEKEFKPRGYKLEKLYARNYKVYTKKINGVVIWCWVAGKTIEIKDYHEDTITIVNYYLENIHNEDKLMKSSDGTKYLNIRYNYKTNEIMNFLDIIKIENFFESDYMIGDWSTIVLRKETWDDIIEELVFLTEGKIKEKPNYKNWEINRSTNKYNL